MSYASVAILVGMSAQILTVGPITVGPNADFDNLAAAIEAARAGDTIEVLGGTHVGPFEIDRPLRLQGLDGPVLDGAGAGDVVTFLVAGGEISGFTVKHSGDRNDREDSGIRAEGTVTITNNVLDDVLYGINLKAAPNSYVAGNTVRGRDIHIARKGDGIRLWESHGSRLLDNEVVEARDVVIWYSEGLEIRGNTVRQGRYGLHYMYSHASVIAENRFERNSVGSFMMYSTGITLSRNAFVANHGPSGYGLAFKDSDSVTIANNVFAGNRVGLYFDNTPSRRDVYNQVAGNTFAYNGMGVAFQPSVKRNVFEANNFIENEQQVAVVATGDFSGNEWTPDGTGNFWSSYAGFDQDGDGYGDVPYRQISLFHDILERHPDLRLFALSPAQMALDLGARAFPVFQPPPVVEDTAPRVTPFETPVEPPPTRSGPMAALAVGFLGLAATTVGWGLTGPAGTRQTE